MLREDFINTDLTHDESQNSGNQSDLPQLDTQLSHLLNDFEFFELDENTSDGSNYEGNHEEKIRYKMKVRYKMKNNSRYFEEEQLFCKFDKHILKTLKRILKRLMISKIGW